MIAIQSASCDCLTSFLKGNHLDLRKKKWVDRSLGGKSVATNVCSRLTRDENMSIGIEVENL